MSDRSWNSIGSEFGKVLKKTKYQKRIKKIKKTSILIGVGILCLIIWFMGMRWIYRGITGADEKEATEELIADCGCSSLDDCLEKNNIDCAWKMYEAEEVKLWPYPELIKLIKAQCSIHLEKEEYLKGWDYIKKQNFDSAENTLKEYEFEYLNNVIDRLLMNGDIKKAKLWAMKASDEHNTEGWRESETSDFNKRKTQRKLLLAKVKEFQ